MSAGTPNESQTAASSEPCSAKIKLVLIYPMTTGRNFDEVLRVIDSLQLTADHQLTTPAQWQPSRWVRLVRCPMRTTS